MKELIFKRWFCCRKEQGKRVLTAIVAVALLVSSLPIEGYAQQTVPTSRNAPRPAARPVKHPTGTERSDSTAVEHAPVAVADSLPSIAEGLNDSEALRANRETLEPDSAMLTAGEAWEADSLMQAAVKAKKEEEWVPREIEFTPDPTKAVWWAALFPGLGQVYNRRYWKLPIIVGGYLGLAYATSWNNGMLTDYNKAYADLLDSDPDTRSYMDLFSPNVKEENIDKTWLRNVISSRKNYFRRNRDLCIICMVGVYLLAMVDAYVDASLSHFDISPDLTMDVAPALMQDGRQRYPSVGLVWAFNF